MKKILIISCMLITALSCKAQIIPIEEQINYMNNEIEIPDGAYIKDVNNLFNKYVGIWIGTHNNKTFELHIEKSTKYFLDISEDILLIRYKITDTTNNLIYDNTNVSNNTDTSIIEGYYMSTNGNYVLNYYNPNGICGLDGEVFIKVSIDNLNHMKLILVLAHDVLNPADCPNGTLELDFPTQQSMTLTKQ